MVKRQKDKQYLSSRESRDIQSIRAGRAGGLTVKNKLPFTHCALSLQPYKVPVCNADGVLFDKDSLFEFVWKHKKDPVSGKAMNVTEIIKIVMEASASDDNERTWICPLTVKKLSDNLKIVAILTKRRTEAYVYSYQAYREFIKAGTHPTTGEPFDKQKDVLIINNPDSDDESFHKNRDIRNFYHIQHARELKAAEGNNDQDNIRKSMTASRVFQKLEAKKRAREGNDDNTRTKLSKTMPIHPYNLQGTILAKDVTGVEYNNDQGAASLTSTGVNLAHQTERAATSEEILQALFDCVKMRFKGEKAYVELTLEVQHAVGTGTSTMTLALEVHCDICPRTCLNFLTLCEGAYVGSSFHRLIPKFMMQGGKSLDEASDTSIWGKPFPDEIDKRLTHSGPGVLSMANAGKNSNQRQFYITFASCPHLDRKHTVFGKLVGDDCISQLKRLEQIPTSKTNEPEQSIRITRTRILGETPLDKAKKLEEARLRAVLEKREANSRKTSTKVTRGPKVSEARGEVGQYLKAKLQAAAAKNNEDVGVRRLPPPPKKTKFGDFSGW